MKITPIELKALGRFRDCCEDSAAGGHDVPKEMMQRLAAVGVVRTLGFGRHETTEFGDWLLAQPPELKVPPMAVPHSWTLVPAEPDDAMQAAGAQAIRIDTTAINKIWTGNAVFRAMIAAAPIVPAAQGDAKDVEPDTRLLDAIRNGVPLEEPVSVCKAMMARRAARVVLDKGVGPLAAVHLVNIGVGGWTHNKETATAYADGFNRGADWLRSSIIEFADSLPSDRAAIAGKAVKA